MHIYEIIAMLCSCCEMKMLVLLCIYRTSDVWQELQEEHTIIELHARLGNRFGIFLVVCMIYHI